MFQYLPYEVQVHILSSVESFKDRFVMSLVSKELCEVVHCKSLWTTVVLSQKLLEDMKVFQTRHREVDDIDDVCDALYIYRLRKLWISSKAPKLLYPLLEYTSEHLTRLDISNCASLDHEYLMKTIIRNCDVLETFEYFPTELLCTHKELKFELTSSPLLEAKWLKLLCIRCTFLKTVKVSTSGKVTEFVWLFQRFQPILQIVAIMVLSGPTLYLDWVWFSYGLTACGSNLRSFAGWLEIDVPEVLQLLDSFVDHPTLTTLEIEYDVYKDEALNDDDLDNMLHVLAGILKTTPLTHFHLYARHRVNKVFTSEDIYAILPTTNDTLKYIGFDCGVMYHRDTAIKERLTLFKALLFVHIGDMKTNSCETDFFNMPSSFYTSDSTTLLPKLRTNQQVGLLYML
jgi:hypothetical protein